MQTSETTVKWTDERPYASAKRSAAGEIGGVALRATEFDTFVTWSAVAKAQYADGVECRVDLDSSVLHGVDLDGAKAMAIAAAPRALRLAQGTPTDRLRRLTDAIAEASRAVESERLRDEEGEPGDPAGVALTSIIGLSAMAREIAGAGSGA